MVTVSDLFFYPLKSARGTPLPAARLGERGFEWDRHWMAVDAASSFITQRTHPQLARIRPELTTDALVLHRDGLEPFSVPLQPQGERVTVQIFKDRCEALDQGDAASEWLSEAIGDAVRLVRITPDMQRMASREYAGREAPVAFADGFPILVCNRASLDHLNTLMPEPIPMERFRPNLVLEGLEPFAEDRIASLQIGPVTLNLVKPCTRCVIPSTDQKTGERTTNPLPVLRKFRFDRKLLGVTFGENAVIVAGVGERIERGALCTVTTDV
ncbi:MAG TPA: MOSC N-terminal beta barrel domain-containing protein [Steroidobacteraceae bacterium]